MKICNMQIHSRTFLQLCIGLILASLPLISFAQNPTYPPKDETYLDSSLSVFVKALLKAIETRDKHFINDALDFYVVSSLDSKGGLDDFKATWSPENDSSQMWPLMQRVIKLGGVFLHDTADESGRYQFVFPYVYDMPLDIEDDYFSIDVVWYVQEDLAGKTVSGTNPYGDPEWYLVETYDRARRGWINWKYLYSPTGPRMFLYKTKKGEWKISAFVSGD